MREARIREELSGNLCAARAMSASVANPRRSGQRAAHPNCQRGSAHVTFSRRDALGVAVYEAKIEVSDVSSGIIPVPERIGRGITLTRSMAVPASVDRLWSTLQDIETIAKCLPGRRSRRSIPMVRSSARSRLRSVQCGRVYRIGAGGLRRILGSGTVRGAAAMASAVRAPTRHSIYACAGRGQWLRLDLDMTYRLSGR